MRAYDMKIILDRLCDRGHGEFEVVFSREGEKEKISSETASADEESKKIVFYSRKAEKSG